MRLVNHLSLFSLALLALIVSGCGYRPLYGQRDSGSSVGELAQVAVAEQKSRSGQLLRNELVAGLGGSSAGTYVLKLDVTEKTQEVSALTFEKTKRYRFRLNAEYQLVDGRSGEKLSKGSSFSSVSYDTVQEPVADVQAAENAVDRAARELAQDIRLRLAAYFAARGT